jgi:long-chain acyl-CoA synthetase
VVPLILAAFERAVRERLDELPAWQRQAVDALLAVNAALTDRGPRHGLSSRLLAPLHQGFGGKLRVMFCGGAFTDRTQAEFFARLGIPVVIGYGLTEACTVVTLNGLSPPRADSVGEAVPGVEVRIHEPGPDGVGEVCVRGPTVMLGYLDDPELTAETLRDGWLHTGDLGWFDASRHLHLCGRIKDLIVSPGGKNVYPEDVEFAFAGLPVEELAVVAANTLWPERTMTGERLVLVVRAPSVEGLLAAVAERNRRLPDFKRVSGILGWDAPFPRTASMKLKRRELASAVAAARGRDAVTSL